MSDAKGKIRIGPLDDIGGLLTEMAKVYRESRRGELAIEDGSRLIHMLGIMRSTLELASLEVRIAALEGKG